MRIIIVLKILQRGDEFESGGKGAGNDHDDKYADHVILMTIILVPMACVATTNDILGSRPVVSAFGRCCRLLLLLHRNNISASNDSTLEQIIVNLVPFLKEIRSRLLLRSRQFPNFLCLFLF